jgi:ribosomal protein L37AE/L43A
MAELSIARATTRFEIRISPKNKDRTENQENLALLKALDECSRMVATCRNVGMRENWRRDADWLDAFIAKNGRMPGKGDIEKGDWWSQEKMYSYPTMRRAAPRLTTAATAWLNKDVDSKWRAIRFDCLIRQTEGIPHCKPTHPIPIPARSVRLTKTDVGALATLRLYSKEVEGSRPVALALVPRDDRQREELEALLSGDWKLGQVVLSRHHEKRGRWFLRMSYTKIVDVKTGPIRVAIRRGIKTLLVGACTDGDVRAIDGGSDIVETQRRFAARRYKEKSLGQDIVDRKRELQDRKRSFGRRARGDGAIGHGTRRSIAPLIKLADKESNYTKDRCKRAASLLVKYALAHGASEVFFEDFSTPKQEGDFWLLSKWPWFILAESCKNALEAVGIAVSTTKTAGNRLHCPACHHDHKERPETSYGVWKCVACGMSRSAEQVQAMNMLNDNAATAKAEEKRKTVLRSVGAAQTAAASKVEEVLRQ